MKKFVLSDIYAEVFVYFVLAGSAVCNAAMHLWRRASSGSITSPFINAYIVLELILLSILSLVSPLKGVINNFISKSYYYEFGSGPHSWQEWLQVLLIYTGIVVAVFLLI